MASVAELMLENGSRIAVVGGGPAGSLCAFFLMRMARQADLAINVDVFEPRDFSVPGGAGCNHCGGIISEWLVQAFAIDGIGLPANVVQRGIDSYTMHLDVGSVRMEAPAAEKRIAAVHRGGGPRDVKERRWRSFDAHLLSLACGQGANWRRQQVEDLRYRNGHIEVKPRGEDFQPYALVVMATGKQGQSLNMVEKLLPNYRRPKMAKAYISEIHLGQAQIDEQLGESMHLFLPDLPNVKFGALIPKGDFVTLCILGSNITDATIASFVGSQEVRRCMPAGWVMPPRPCHCAPELAVKGACQPYADRVLFVGDCSVSRLYKDGIGAAYRSAKAAAIAVVYRGVSARALRRHYWPTLRNIVIDNLFGRGIFLVTTLIQKCSLLRGAVLRMVRAEQTNSGGSHRMTEVLWDTFTGSAPYRDVFLRTLHPAFWGTLALNVLAQLKTLLHRKLSHEPEPTRQTAP